MGLDMYASRKHYVKNWDFEQHVERYAVNATLGGKPIPNLDPERITYIEEEIMVWRKANHIHAWFVDHVQDGRDDCRAYYVDGPKPPIYHLATTLCRDLRSKAAFVSARAWELEMAIRDVRHATLGAEKAIAVSRLQAKLEELTEEK